VLGGGNIKGGMAYGSTTPDGQEPKDKPAKIEDFYSTIYAGLGLDPNSQIRDSLGRPTAIAGEKVNPIKDLLTVMPKPKV
jgi:hypothetical protein